MSYTSWHVGMKVVCVDDRPTLENGVLAKWLEKGRVYTIAEIAEWEWAYKVNPGNTVGVFLHEIKRPSPYGIVRFRAVTNRTTDISIFTALLNPSGTEKLRELEAEMQAR